MSQEFPKDARRRRIPLPPFVGLLVASCVGTIDPGPSPEQTAGRPPDRSPAAAPARVDGPSGSGVAPSGTAPVTPAPAACATPLAEAAPLRRLTRTEYDRTVADLLGDTSAPARGFAPDERVGAFESNAESVPPELVVSQFRDAAERLAAATAPRLWKELVCTSGDATCGARFVAGFGRRAFRRPLAAEEQARYVGLFDGAARERGAEAGARLVVQAMLQSPHFLYHVAGHAPPDPRTRVARVDAHALAARLSYFLWQSPPDAELSAAADRGQLGTPSLVEAQARRLLASPRARATIAAFHAAWLGIDQIDRVEVDAAKYPLFGGELAAAMRAETEGFIDHVMTREGGRLATLLTAPFTILADGVAALYGVTGKAGERVALDPKRRAGLLTQPAVLTANHGPILRGKLIRTRVLCQEVPPPPPGISTDLPPARSDQSPRQRLEAHVKDPMCAACHRFMDPIGFGFDHFDDVGRWRDVHDGGFPIDATGEIALDGAAAASFDGAVDLVKALSTTEQAATCVARQWLQFAVGRAYGASDRCALERTVDAFRRSGHDVRELIVALAASDALALVHVEAP